MDRLRQSVVYDSNVVFANNAVINNKQTLTVPSMDIAIDEYQIVVNNPSTVSDLTIELYSVETFNGVQKDAFIETLTIPKKTTRTNGKSVEAHCEYIHGVLNGAALRIEISNNVALGAAEGFTTYVKLRAM